MGDFLTQEQVNELEIGVRVEVVWSGGNGPHEYTIMGRHGDEVYVDTAKHDFLDFVGDAPPFTTVRLAP